MKKLFLLAAAAGLGIVTCGCGVTAAKPYFYVRSDNRGYWVAIDDKLSDATYITTKPLTVEKAKALADKLNKDLEDSDGWPTAEECGRR